MPPAMTRACLCLLLAGTFFGGKPVEAISPASNWSVHVWRSDDGLPNNNVTGLAQTPDGYLWVATVSYPARFDGVQFEGHSLRDFNVPASQKITALLSGQDGLWFGTFHGQVILLNS